VESSHFPNRYCLGFRCVGLSVWTIAGGDFLMTLTDGIILLIVGLMIVGFIAMNIKNQDPNVCSKCAYAKACTDDCEPKKKKISR
jgi:tetrahydromethanopterin S-methyltransferase subunit E